MQLWEAKMTLALEEESQHREFDTRQYGDELIDKFEEKVGTDIDFTKVYNFKIFLIFICLFLRCLIQFLMIMIDLVIFLFHLFWRIWEI